MSHPYFASDRDPNGHQNNTSFSRNGHRMMEEEGDRFPRTHAPVSLEDYIVYKPSARNRMRSDAKRPPPISTQPPIAPKSSEFNYDPRPASAYPTTSVFQRQPSTTMSTKSSRVPSTASLTLPFLPVENGHPRSLRQYDHTNGDISMLQWSNEDQKYLAIGRIDEADKSYFLRFCERSINDNRHDPQKMELYREHIITMVKHLSEKRTKVLANAEKAKAAARAAPAPKIPTELASEKSEKTPSSNGVSDYITPRTKLAQVAMPLYQRGPTAEQVSKIQGYHAASFDPTYGSGPTAYPIKPPPQPTFIGLDLGARQRYRERERQRLEQTMRQPLSIQFGDTTPTATHFFRSSQHMEAAEKPMFEEDPKPYPSQNGSPRDIQSTEPPLTAFRSTTFTKKPDEICDFVPLHKQRRPAPNTLTELVADSAPGSFDDDRLKKRKREEDAQLIEPSSMTDEELRAASNPHKPYQFCRRAGMTALDDAGKAKAANTLPDFWESGRSSFKETSTYADGMLSLGEEPKTKEATCLMAAVYSALVQYHNVSQAKRLGKPVEYFARFSTGTPEKTVAGSAGVISGGKS